MHDPHDRFQVAWSLICQSMYYLSPHSMKVSSDGLSGINFKNNNHVVFVCVGKDQYTNVSFQYVTYTDYFTTPHHPLCLCALLRILLFPDFI